MPDSSYGVNSHKSFKNNTNKRPPPDAITTRGGQISKV
jgi:hypothetical protein